MNLVRPQTPYQFMPPKYSWAFRPFLHALARFSLKNTFKVTDVKISGHETLTQLVQEKQSVMVAPNHADHADPALIITVGRRCKFAFHFMAAREGFENNRLESWILQRGGAFSINREGADLASIKMAMKILQAGEFPLVVFPEGEIYHHMETLDELNEGVASIALRAAANLPEGRSGYVVPTFIRLSHDPSIEETFSDRLSILEKRITLKPRINDTPVNRIFLLGAALLSIKEVEFLGRARQGTLTERIRHLRRYILDNVETQHGLSNGKLSMPKRIKALRARIRKVLVGGGEELTQNRKHELYDRLDQIFVAHQLYSYPRTYLLGNPSIDRIAETIFKLEEDVLGKGAYLGERKANIQFDDPIDLADFLKENGLNHKTGILPLTRLIEKRITTLQSGPGSCPNP